MRECPPRIADARVICYTPIDHRHRYTGRTKHIAGGVPTGTGAASHFEGGVLMGQPAGLAICQVDGETCYYLFGCDAEWCSFSDTWHETLEDAMAQAEHEFEGTRATWTHQVPPPAG
jgi:hypothetical protein